MYYRLCKKCFIFTFLISWKLKIKTDAMWPSSKSVGLVIVCLLSLLVQILIAPEIPFTFDLKYLYSQHPRSNIPAPEMPTWRHYHMFEDSYWQHRYSEVQNRQADRNKQTGLEKRGILLVYLLINKWTEWNFSFITLKIVNRVERKSEKTKQACSFN